MAMLLSAMVLLTTVVFGNLGLVQTQERHVVLRDGVVAVVLGFALFLSVAFLCKLTDEYSRATFLLQLVNVSAVVLWVRSFLYGRLRSAVGRGRLEARRVALIGDARTCANMAKTLALSAIQTVASFPFPGEEDGWSDSEQGLRALIDACRGLKLHDLLIVGAKDNWSAQTRLAEALSELPVGLHIVPFVGESIFSTSRIAAFGEVTTIQVALPPLSRVDKVVKRAFDVVAAACGLVLFAPLFLVSALAIKLDSRGPVFFRQQRHGYNNETFWIFKFRTMKVAADGDKFRQAQRNDARITRIGGLLRRSNIDELPQLINVVLGEMSIVGPRPHATVHNEMFKELIPPLSRRHNVKPGITGWAQVNGLRGETDTVEKMRRRVEYDLHYIDNWSFWFDLKIILKTTFSKEAYLNAY